MLPPPHRDAPTYPSALVLSASSRRAMPSGLHHTESRANNEQHSGPCTGDGYAQDVSRMPEGCEGHRGVLNAGEGALSSDLRTIASAEDTLQVQCDGGMFAWQVTRPAKVRVLCSVTTILGISRSKPVCCECSSFIPFVVLATAGLVLFVDTILLILRVVGTLFSHCGSPYSRGRHRTSFSWTYIAPYQGHMTTAGKSDYGTISHSAAAQTSRAAP